MNKKVKSVEPLPKEVVEDFSLDEYIEWTEEEEDEFMRILETQTKDKESDSK